MTNSEGRVVTNDMGPSTLRVMQGTATVLIVSLGEVPEGLRHELSRLGVRIVPCAFSDAEECIQSESPDLVVLMGALGAMELAMVLEDQPTDSNVRMVIVAERRELAKLRGLNREIVISLFATETTERVVAHRIESLARRAVRRRLYGNSMAPTPSMGQRDATGMLAGLLSDEKPRMDAPAPDFIVDSRRSRDAAEVVAARVPSNVPLGAELAKTAVLGSASDTKTSMGLPSGKPGSRVPVPSAGSPGAPPDSAGQPFALEPTVEKREAATRPDPLGATTAQDFPFVDEVRKKPPPPSTVASQVAPADSNAEERGPDSLVVIDDELLESLPPSDVPEADQSVLIQSIPALPFFSPSSTPPALLEEVKVEAPATSRGTVKLKQEDLDVTDALSALDDLESARLTPGEEAAVREALGEELAQRGDRASAPAIEITEQVPASTTSVETESSSATKSEPVKLDEKAPPREEQRSQGPSKNPAKSGASSRPPGSLSRDEAARILGRSSKPPAKASRMWGVLGVIVMGAIGVGIGFKQSANESEVASAESPLKEPVPPPVEAPPVSATETKAVPVTPPADPAEGEGANDLQEANGEPPEEVPPASDEAQVEQVSPPTPSMENPFRVQEVKMPTCDTLTSENPVQEVTDPIQAASKIWDDARKAIVNGRVQQAHVFMCQAAALNPESAAVEGLAHHYLRGRSVDQALAWLEKADALRPGQLEMTNLRGDLYGMSGETEKAREIWLQALNVPATETARIVSISKDYSVEAGRHLRRGDLILAELWYRRAVILNPENLTGLVGLARTYQRAEMSDYARAFCELSLKVSDVVPEVHVMLGEIALADGNKSEAKQRFERALKVRPDFFPAQRGLAQVE